MSRLAVLLALAACASTASAHRADPSLAVVDARDPHHVTVSWRPAIPGAAGPTVEGEALRLPYVGADILVELHRADGTVDLSMQLPGAVVPLALTSNAPPRTSLAGFVRLGALHIGGGFDHLLFLTGLFALIGWRRRLWWAVTGFSLGHSLTLALVALGVLHLPPALVESWIALSLLVVGVQLARRDAAPPSALSALGTSALFGLVHGGGFAEGLSELVGAGANLWRALVGFNLGIELGQLALVACLALAWKLAAREPARARLTAAYALGVGGVFLLLDRIGRFAQW